MKKLAICCIGILLAIICICVPFYSIKNSIKNRDEDINKSLIEEIHKSKPEIKVITVLSQSSVGGRKLVLFACDEKLGYGEFKKSMFGRLTLRNVTFNFNENRAEVIDTGKGKYLICFGRRSNINKKTQIVTIDSIQYRLDLPDRDYFIVYCAVPKYTKLGAYPVD